ncbi:MAG: sigma-70 family RNA polymerase sigma factor [Saprospiraceae bacterium]
MNSIIKACASDDPNAQRELVTLYYVYASKICRLYGKSEEECDEMINDGFLKVLNNIHKYDYSKAFKGWMRAIFINSCIDYYRKYYQKNNVVSLELIHDVEVDTDIISTLSAEELMSLVTRLPDSCRIVFILYVIDGYKHHEIGELLGIQEGTSKSNLRDARIKLKKLIFNEYGEHTFIPYSKKVDHD